MIRVRKIFYEGERYYMIHFKYDQYIIDRLRRIDHCAWSPAKKGWLMPQTPDAWSAFKDLFEQEEYQFERAFLSPRLSGYRASIKVSTMPTDAQRLIVRMRKYNQSQLDAIRKITNRRYHKDMKYWSVPNTEQARDELREYFGDLVEFENA